MNHEGIWYSNKPTRTIQRWSLYPRPHRNNDQWMLPSEKMWSMTGLTYVQRRALVAATSSSYSTQYEHHLELAIWQSGK